MTCSAEIFDRSVMMSSVMPSEKYSCSGSPLMLLNGSTAIDGFSFAGSALACRAVRRARRRRAVEEVDVVDPDRPVDVLQRLLAGILEREVELVADTVADRARYGDAARLAMLSMRAAMLTPSP